MFSGSRQLMVRSVSDSTVPLLITEFFKSFSDKNPRPAKMGPCRGVSKHNMGVARERRRSERRGRQDEAFEVETFSVQN